MRLGTIATMNPQHTDFKVTVDALNKYIAANRIPPEMAMRLRDYFHRTRHLWTSGANIKVPTKMPLAFSHLARATPTAVWESRSRGFTRTAVGVAACAGGMACDGCWVGAGCRQVLLWPVLGRDRETVVSARVARTARITLTLSIHYIL